MRTSLIGNLVFVENSSDIKPENFLLKNKGDITNIKLIDFGLSRDTSIVKLMQTPCGSVYLVLFKLIAVLHCSRSV
jgi:hypothetical protein